MKDLDIRAVVSTYKTKFDALRGNSSTQEQRYQLASLITEYFHALHPDYSSPIVVGGLSLEYYTQGDYATTDIDWVTPYQEELFEALKAVGFERNSTSMFRKDIHAFVEVVSNTLKGADLDRVQRVKLSNGSEFSIISPEDIFADRTKRVLYWNRPQELKFLEKLYSNFPQMDWDYIRDEALETDLEREFLDDFIDYNEGKRLAIMLKEFPMVYVEKSSGDIEFQLGNRDNVEDFVALHDAVLKDPDEGYNSSDDGAILSAALNDDVYMFVVSNEDYYVNRPNVGKSSFNISDVTSKNGVSITEEELKTDLGIVS
jgi:hypothetical protein